MAVWDDVIGERDRRVYDAAGYGAAQELGSRPAVLVVDVNYAFTGPAPLPIQEAVKWSRTSCGEAAWNAIPAIRRLLDAARRAGVPVVYSTGRRVASPTDLGRWAGKNRRAAEDVPAEAADRLRIVAEIGPHAGDLVIEKSKPSVFFGTELLPYLIDAGVDSLLVVGGTTSGCVRATVVDGFSYNFRVAVVQDATFDRGELSHKVGLFDMHAKYASVIPLEAALAYLTVTGRAGR